MVRVLKDAVRRLVPEETRQGIRRALEDGQKHAKEARRFLKRPDVYDLSSKERSGVIFLADSHQTTPERFILYALVRALQPSRILEIGTRHGGSASIIAAALEDNGRGHIVGLDPAPESTTPEKRYYGRFTLLQKPSPDAIAEARELAGGPFDFVHFDSIVTYRQIRSDLDGTLPHVAGCACFLLNNPFHYGVDKAIKEFVLENDNVFDSGQLSVGIDTENEPKMAYAGLRMLRIRPTETDECQPYIDEAFDAAGKPKPTFRPDMINHDVWYCRCIEKCEACKEEESD